MTEPEESTLNILLKEILELKEAINQLKYDKELIDRQFRNFGASIQNTTENNSRIDGTSRRTEAVLASGRQTDPNREEGHWLLYG